MSAGTLRMLVCTLSEALRDGTHRIEGACHLAHHGEPHGTHFSVGDDVMNGEGDFGDTDTPAEFADRPEPTDGLWIVEWDWSMQWDENLQDAAPSYAAERWTRPTLDDLMEFGMLPILSMKQ